MPTPPVLSSQLWSELPVNSRLDADNHDEQTEDIRNLLTYINSVALQHKEQTLSDAATTNWNLNNGYIANWVINGAGRNLNITNPVAGFSFVLRLTLTDRATQTPNYPANWRFQYGAAPDLTTTDKTLFTLQWIPAESVFWVFAGTGFN